MDFLRHEYADQLGANYSDLNTVPAMLARLRRARHRQVHPELSSPQPTPGVTPSANAVEPWRHRRRRRRRRDEIQQRDFTAAVTSIPPAPSSTESSRTYDDPTKATSGESTVVKSHQYRRQPTTEVASASSTADTEDGKTEAPDAELTDERAEYAERLLKIAHGLHYGSIVILGVFVFQVRFTVYGMIFWRRSVL